MCRHYLPIITVAVGLLSLPQRTAFAQMRTDEIPTIVGNDRSLNTLPHLPVEPVDTATRILREPFELSGRILSSDEYIEVSLTEAQVVADGHSVLHMRIRVLDSARRPIIAPVRISLNTQLGRFRLSDGRLVSSAYAVVVDGQKDLELVASTIAGTNLIQVGSGPVTAIGKMLFVAPPRPLFAVGIVDITRMVARSTGDGALDGKIGFEDNFHRWDGPNQSGAVYQNGSQRVAGFIKGTLYQDFIVTGSYDSQKINQEKFFADINPNDYYPMYGDTSIVHYDARSTSKLYLRVDQGKNSVMFGDYRSHEASQPLRLGSYSRTLNGLYGHYDDGIWSGTAFASRTARTTMVDEQPGLGLSGPYSVSRLNALANSEQISILVRDRYQPARVISITPMTRHVDYEFEPFSGRIIFRTPVAGIDENLNPVSIRVIYEVDRGGPRFWVGGVDAQVTPASGLTLSARHARDQNPLTDKVLSGATAEWTAGGTHLLVDVARSSGSDMAADALLSAQRPAGSVASANATAFLSKDASGNAYHAEITHGSGPFTADASISRTDSQFENTSAGIPSGRREGSAKARYAIDETLAVSARGRFSEDLVGHGEQSNVGVSLDWRPAPKLRLNFGAQHVQQKDSGAVTPQGSFAALALPSAGDANGLHANGFGAESLRYNPFSNAVASASCGAAPACEFEKEYTSGYIQARYDITPAWNIDALAEKSVAGDAGHRFMLGTQYRFKDVGRLYGRYENIDKLLTGYGASADTRGSNRFVLGVDTAYMKGGNVFDELRLARGDGDAETVNAAGVRNVFSLTDNLVATTSVENQILSSHAGVRRAKALAGGLEYAPSSLWRIGGRLEYRVSDTQLNWLSAASAVRRLNNDWSVLVRNLMLASRGQGAASGQDQTQDRFQLGLAFRDTGTNQLNAIGRYEHNIDRTRGTANSSGLRNDIVALTANYRPRPAWTMSASTAFKRQVDEFNGPSSTFDGKLVSARVMYDVNDRLDVGLLGSYSWGGGTRDRGMGVEVGYRLLKNLWLSGGYIAGRYADSELYSTNHQWQAFYLRLRFKFDENLLTR